jgi:hypothetical protein
VGALLARVRYKDPIISGLTVETVWGDWVDVGGEKVPGLVQRLENGAVKFTVRTSAHQFQPRANDSAFTRP